MKRAGCYAIVVLVAAIPFVIAPAAADELADLKAQVEVMLQRIEALEAQANQAAEVPAPGSTDTS